MRPFQISAINVVLELNVGVDSMDLVPFMREQIETLKVRGKLLSTRIDKIPANFDIERFMDAVNALCKVEADYLHPELKGVFKGSELTQKRCLLALDTIHKVAEAGKSRWQGLVEADEAVGWVNSVFEHFEYLEREFLPKVRQHLGTEQREELVQIMLDALQLAEIGGVSGSRRIPFAVNSTAAARG